MTYYALVAEFKRRVLAHALDAAGGSIAGAARLLGVGRPYLSKMLRDGPGQRHPYRCPRCAHGWVSHGPTGCQIPTCQCRLLGAHALRPHANTARNTRQGQNVDHV